MKLKHFALALKAHVIILQNLHRKTVNPVAKQYTSSVVCTIAIQLCYNKITKTRMKNLKEKWGSIFATKVRKQETTFLG